MLPDAMIGTFDKFLSYLYSPDDGNHDKDTSIRDFYEFCISDRVLEEPDIDEMVNMKMLLTHWMSSYNKQSRARFWERQELDYSMIVTPEHVQIYENNISAEYAKHLFSVYESGADRFVTQAEYTSLRDHLFVIIHFGQWSQKWCDS